MRRMLQFNVTIFALCLLLPQIGCGSIRERVKARWIEKQAEKPAPATVEAPASGLAVGDTTSSIRVGELTRYYKVHVPAKYKQDVPAPLLMIFHGGGGNMEIQSNDEFYKQIAKSESEGFVAVFLNGASQFKSGELATWNAGRCCAYARDTKVDDVLFVRQLLSKLRAQVSIDPKRIFATGMSNGGMMAYRLACEMSDTFRAIAAVAGTDNTLECKPAHSLSVLHIHAKDDDHVLFEGGAGKSAFPDRSQVTEFTSVPATIAKWREFERCASPAVRFLEKPGAYCERSSCRDGVKVQLCVTDKGGHSWPGGKKPRRGAGGSPSTAISANDVMWEFFNGL